MIGAVLIGVLLEVLRDPGDSRVLFYSVIVLGLVRGASPLVRARRGARRARSCSGSSSTRSRTRSTTPGSTAAAARAAAWPTSWPTGSSCPSAPARLGRARLVRLARRAGAPPHAAAGLGAARAARAGALPGRVRLGERHAREAGADALHHPRRAPDRADDRCARRGCSARSAWRSSRWLREAARPAGRLDVVRRPEGDRRPRPARRRGRDRQRDRPERRRQDDAVQPRHGRLRADRRRHRLRGLEHQGPRAAPDHAPRDRPHVPDAAPVPQHDACART